MSSLSSGRGASHGTADPTSPRWGSPILWASVAAAEVVLAIVVVAFDAFIPSLVLLVLAAVSLVLRRQGPATLGAVLPARSGRMLALVLAVTLAWNAGTFFVLIPLLETVIGSRQDVSGFIALQGNIPLLLIMLAFTWTLAAVGEEFAFRGYLQTRLRDLLPGRAGLAAAVVLSSALFGLIHTEQGVVGVTVATLDGVFFSVLRCRFRTIWAAVFAHGVGNTVGMVTFFFFGPVHAPW